MKHIFTSKDSLNNARCRSIRQLEAELDRQGLNDSNSLSKVLSGATKQGGIKSQDDTRQHYSERSASLPVDNPPAHTLGGFSELNTLSNPQEICKYSNYCNVKYLVKVCVPEFCETYKFYNRYNNFDYGRQLGI